jgi:hypothetical protein
MGGLFWRALFVFFTQFSRPGRACACPCPSSTDAADNWSLQETGLKGLFFNPDRKIILNFHMEGVFF